MLRSVSNPCLLCRSARTHWKTFEKGKFLAFSTSYKSARFSSSLVSEKLASNPDLITHGAHEFGWNAFTYLKTSAVVQDALIYLTDTVGITWPVALGLCAVSTRVLLIPVSIFLKKYQTRRENLAPQRMKSITEEFERIKAIYKVDPSYDISKSQKILISKGFLFDQKHGVSVLNVFKPALIQLPVLLTMFAAIQDLSERRFDGLVNSGGCAWISDLTLSDPTCLLLLGYSIPVPLLPLINLTTIYFVLRLGIDGPVTPQLKTKKVALAYFTCATFIAHGMNSYFPSALIIYWFLSNCTGFVISAGLKIEPIRKMCKIPRKVEHPVDFDEYGMNRKMTNELYALAKQQMNQQQLSNKLQIQQQIIQNAKLQEMNRKKKLSASKREEEVPRHQQGEEPQPTNSLESNRTQIDHKAVDWFLQRRKISTSNVAKRIRKREEDDEKGRLS